MWIMPSVTILDVIDPTKHVFDGEANGNEILYPPEDGMPTIAFRNPRGDFDKVSGSPYND
jgi:hypothetical protein